MSERPAGAKPENDIYTVLLIVATVMTLAATVFMGMRSDELFGSWNPFTGV